jgi:hypothetical protein
MEGDFVWSLKWASNISESYYQTIQKIFGQFYEDIFGWLYSVSHGESFVKTQTMFSKV